MKVNQRRSTIHMDDKNQSLDHGTMSAHSLNISNTNVASGIRDYLPGDRFSWIDWKQTARNNTMVTKEFEQEKRADTLVVLNCTGNDRCNASTFEATVDR